MEKVEERPVFGPQTKIKNGINQQNNSAKLRNVEEQQGMVDVQYQPERSVMRGRGIIQRSNPAPTSSNPGIQLAQVVGRQANNSRKGR